MLSEELEDCTYEVAASAAINALYRIHPQPTQVMEALVRWVQAKRWAHAAATMFPCCCPPPHQPTTQPTLPLPPVLPQ